jgi:uncharacterized protein (DUF305 family)
MHLCVSTSRVLCGLMGLTLALGACSKGEQTVDSAAGTSAAAPTTSNLPADTTPAHDMGAMQGMAGMTGDADHDFLRMMSDHHKGLIQMAHMTKDRKETGPSVADAKKLDAEQDKELDHMVTMLEKDFKDPYTPKVMPEHQAMADELKAKAGKDYDRTFYQHVIKHHEEAIKMVDDYLPKAKNAMLKDMATTMKAAQTKEISEFQQKVAKLGT